VSQCYITHFASDSAKPQVLMRSQQNRSKSEERESTGQNAQNMCGDLGNWTTRVEK